MKKLVLFGDSLFGEVRKTETLMLESALNGEYDVYNCATGGWNTNDLARKAAYIAALQPDAVVISVGTNDAAPWKRVELDVFKTNLPAIVSAFNASRVIFFPPPPVAENLPSSEKYIPNQELKQYHDAILELCRNKSLDFVDSWEVFEPLLSGAKSYHIEDGVHLSKYGYQMLFETLSKVVEK